jgi:2-keto-myo-inositol isomerase
MPGKGTIPIADVADAVRAAGYDGPACLELFRPEYWGMSADAVIKMGAECTRPYL